MPARRRLFYRVRRLWLRGLLHAGVTAAPDAGGVAMFHTGRCGSTVLAHMLQQNSRLLWDEECLRPPLWPRGGDIGAYLALGRRWSGKRLPGIEVKPYHARYHGYALAEFTAMLESAGFSHFIILRRRNLLRQVVSSRILEESGRSHLAAGSSPRLHCVTLDVQQLQRHLESGSLVDHFQAMQRDYDLLAQCLAGRPCLRLCYEDHVAPDPRRGYESICRFLQVEPQPVAVTLARSNPFPLCDVIRNYADVEKLLAGTPYEWMLGD